MSTLHNDWYISISPFKNYMKPGLEQTYVVMHRHSPRFKFLFLVHLFFLLPVINNEYQTTNVVWNLASKELIKSKHLPLPVQNNSCNYLCTKNYNLFIGLKQMFSYCPVMHGKLAANCAKIDKLYISSLKADLLVQTFWNCTTRRKVDGL